ncbi:MAG: hypothetical protein H6732_19035 [Alphaproteobacteria bacterium]|nr:hypothetical protein [Alphaproteobacteria bacterium]
MRLRRGNYAILFVLTVTVMLSYLAFSIDGGRMRVAYVQAENASEAAAIAALAILRDGGSESEAQDAADEAAAQVRLQRIGSTRVGDSDWSTVELTFGEWDWGLATDDIDTRWSGDDTMVQAVTANVSLAGGALPTIFAPAIDMVSRQGGGAGAEDVESFTVGSGVRAAMRHRDIIVAIDVSHLNLANIDNIQTGLAAFVAQMQAFDIPEDRVGFVAYAGNSWAYDLANPSGVADGTAGESITGFFEIRVDGDNMIDIAGSVEPCNVGPEAWFYAYRHLPRASDAEVAGSAFDAMPFGLPAPAGYHFLSSVGGFVLDDDGDGGTNRDFFEDLIEPFVPPIDLALLKAQFIGSANNPIAPTHLQCYPWLAMEFYFSTNDPRTSSVLRPPGSAPSPLACHEGNFFEGSPDKLVSGAPTSVFNVDCTGVAGVPPGPVPGDPDPSNARYVRSDAVAAGLFAQLDQSFFQAGHNPGAGLQRAFDLLNVRTTSGEPTVILIAGNGSECGPNVDAFDASARASCEGQFGGEAAAARDALEAIDATTHVVALATTGSDADVELSALVTGRGAYVRVDPGTSFDAEMVQLARDVRIQVVR